MIKESAINSSSTISGQRRAVIVPLVVLAVVTMLPFINALSNGFVWLDRVEIEEGGYRIESADDLRKMWTLTLDQYLTRKQGTTVSQGGYFRPLYGMAISLDYFLWGPNPLAFHLTNVIWHIVVVWLLFILGLRLTSDRLIAFFGAMLFGVHPTMISSVTWISGRKDVLCAAFGLAAIITFLVACQTDRDWRRWLFAMLSYVSCAIALLVKELGIVVPVMALASLFWLRLRGGDRLWSGRDIAAWLPMAVLAGLLLVHRYLFLGGVGLDAEYPASNPILNLATSGRVFLWYLIKITIPSPPMLSDAWPVSHGIGIPELAGLIAICGVVLGCIIALRRRHPIGIALLFFLIWMLPATGLVPLRHFRAERYLYPASWGILIVLAYAGVAVAGFMQRKFGGIAVKTDRRAINPAAVVLALIVAWCGFVTFRSNYYWSDDRSLFADATRRDPFYTEGYSGLAADSLSSGDYQSSVEFGQRAVRLASDSARVSYWSPYVTRTNLGLAHYYLGQYVEAEQHLAIAVENWPGDSRAQYHLGLVYQALGDYQRAVDHYQRSLAVRPDDFLARSNLAASYIQLLRFDDAIPILHQLIAEKPDDQQNRLNLANACLASRRDAEALPLLQSLIDETPNDLTILVKLAMCHWRLGNQIDARTFVEMAEKVDPRHPNVLLVDQMTRHPK